MDLEINKRIRKYREEKKISQEKVGKAIGMKCNAYSRMEREGNITVDDVFAIAKALDIDPDLIFYGEKRVEKQAEKPLDFTRIQTPIIHVEDPLKNTFLNNGPSLYVKYDCDGFQLTEEEKNVIKIFRNLPDDKKDYVRDYFSKNY